jgi:hypothetical protein
MVEKTTDEKTDVNELQRLINTAMALYGEEQKQTMLVLEAVERYHAQRQRELSTEILIYGVMIVALIVALASIILWG